jgi:predicted dehydrogenase
LNINLPFNPTGKATLKLHPKQGDDRLVVIPNEDLYAGEVEDMAAAVVDGAPQCVSLADSRANVATILALYRSAREGRPLKMDK